jgi:hypothetical protein
MTTATGWPASALCVVSIAVAVAAVLGWRLL